MILETKKLSYSIDGTSILKNITFGIERGSFTGIVGPNGSGKTTLIQCLSGVYIPTSGYALLDLMYIQKLVPKIVSQSIAVVPQEFSFSFPFTCLQIVLMGRHPHMGRFDLDNWEDISIAKKVMELTGCWEFRDRNIQTLSGGEKQKVLLARALAQRPKILLLDEPASHLDVSHQREIFNLLTRLNQEEGLTVLCVIHDLNLALSYCKRLVFLKDGQIVFDKKKEEVNESLLESVFSLPFDRLSCEGHNYFIPSLG